MRRTIFTLCIFLALIISAKGGEIYFCIDRDGNSVFTDSPREGMTNCVLKESYTEPSPENTTGEKRNVIIEKDNVIEKERETSEARVKRINNCINCCNERISGCYNYTADIRLCYAESQDCVAMCKSEGSSSSSWKDCWFQSLK